MIWCKPSEIAEDDGRLLDPAVGIDLGKIAEQATACVRDDVAALVDLPSIDAADVPPQLRMLAIIKGREKAWTKYYSGSRPERSEADTAHQDYERRLDRLRKDIQSGYLTRDLGRKETPEPPTLRANFI